MVWVHGGPTSRAPMVLDLEIAYFTSRGIGVAEVNYGGSTGYGRAYRNRLREQWGVVDVEDCAAVADGLVAEGAADPDRLAIRGGSAGGWTSAAALTSTDHLRLRHGHLPDPRPARLVAGGRRDPRLRVAVPGVAGRTARRGARALRDRSPIHHGDRIGVPFLLLQGLDDVICPPAQCERFLAAVAGRGIPHAYLAFAGESHGFRRLETMVTCLEAELSLYGQVFGFTPPASRPWS